MDLAGMLVRYYGFQFRIMSASAQENVQMVANQNEKICRVLHASLLPLHLL